MRGRFNDREDRTFVAIGTDADFFKLEAKTTENSISNRTD